MKKFIIWLKGFKFTNWRKKHDNLQRAAVDLLQERDDKYKTMHSYMRACVNRLEAELSKARANSGQFTQDELRSLVQLVHPDKHGGKEVAVRMTQKINSLRK